MKKYIVLAAAVMAFAGVAQARTVDGETSRELVHALHEAGAQVNHPDRFTDVISAYDVSCVEHFMPRNLECRFVSPRTSTLVRPPFSGDRAVTLVRALERAGIYGSNEFSHHGTAKVFHVDSIRCKFNNPHSISSAIFSTCDLE